MGKMILDFFKSLFDINSNTDEKVVVGFMSFAMMVIIALCTLFFGLTVPYELFATFAALTFACFGLGTVATVKSMSVKSDVASNIIKNDSSVQSNDAATEVIQSSKPQ